MAVVVRYNPKGVSFEQAEAVSRRFREKGMELGQEGPPDDLMVHVRFGDQDAMMISEIWSSEEAWRHHYETFMTPVFAELGIETSPEVFEVYNVWGSGVPAAPTAQPA